MANSTRFWAFIEHPRTAFIAGLVLGGASHYVSSIWAIVLLSLAGLLILRSGWEWKPIRSRVPFNLQSPIVYTGRQPRIVPIPPELGRIDFEVRVMEASNQIGSLLTKMGEEMTLSAKRIQRETEKVTRATGESAQRRLAAFNSGQRSSRSTPNIWDGLKFNIESAFKS